MSATRRASELETSNEAYQKIFREVPPSSPSAIRDLPLDKLIPFFTADIGFKPYPPSKLKAFAEQLSEEGLMVRIIVRPIGGGSYEILAGHNRANAAKLAGWAEIPAEVVDADDARAIVIAISTNLRSGLRGERSAVRQEDMDDYRALIRENIAYNRFVRDHPYDAPQLDELVELMVEAVCSKRSALRVAGSDFPQAVVKSRLLKLERAHIQFVLDCLRENTTRVKNIKQYLLTVLYNAPVTMENHYAARVNHDLYAPEGTP